MTRCATCGNEYPRTFTVTSAGGETLEFDSFECAIHRLAPRCIHCGIAVVGHGVEDEGGTVYCCANCARMHGVSTLVDRDRGMHGDVLPEPVDDEVDAAVEGTFPASDPSSYWARET